MADHVSMSSSYANHPDQPVPMHSTYMDYPEHERTFSWFTTAVKWVATGVAVLLLLLAYFLV